uniref:KIB1-4 beta-propeller domain-containing protein n=1 Tax=Aegilops tauschii TaxID=37682 RepID=N1R251_AEGTA
MASSGAHERRPRSRRDWANLDAGPVGLVAEHLLRNDVVDLVRLRAVCRSWRASSAHLRAQGVLDRRFHPRRWIMLPKEFDIRGRRRFLNVFTGKSIYQGLPYVDLLSEYVLTTTFEGLILQLGTCTGKLLNPLTGQVAGLPSAATLLFGQTLSNLEVSGVGLANDDTVVLHFRSFYVAVAKPGDERWTHVHSHDRIISVLPFAGHIYCATSKNISSVQTQTAAANQPPRLVVAADHGLHTGFQSLEEFEYQLFMGDSQIFLMENNGELIMCHRTHSCSPQIVGDCNVSMYRVNWNAKNTVPQHGLDGKVLFLGKKILQVAPGVSPSISADSKYLCWSKTKCNYDATDYAVDVLLGGGAEAKFKKDDAAYYLSCYVSHSYSEHV